MLDMGRRQHRDEGRASAAVVDTAQGGASERDDDMVEQAEDVEQTEEGRWTGAFAMILVLREHHRDWSVCREKGRGGHPSAMQPDSATRDCSAPGRTLCEDHRVWSVCNEKEVAHLRKEGLVGPGVQAT
ncbi:hypothetical protein L7F22_037578 [Adiantum nelumboides]|nr:hypothetical protein [Adiantum nelumboides]